MPRSSASSAARVGRAAGKERLTTASRKIDFSDIPELSAAQLRAMRRVGRPLVIKAAKKRVA